MLKRGLQENGEIGALQSSKVEPCMKAGERNGVNAQLMTVVTN